MSFKNFPAVEICKKEEGFSGIYYRATVLTAFGNKYTVRYADRFNKDGSWGLIDTVDLDEIRPLPPPTPDDNFFLSDRVDVFVNLAWRVGTVTRKVHPNYYVKLDCYGNEEHFCASKNVRLHQEWHNGRWFFPGSGTQSNQAKTLAQGDQPANDGNQANTEDQKGQPKNEGDQPSAGQGKEDSLEH